LNRHGVKVTEMRGLMMLTLLLATLAVAAQKAPPPTPKLDKLLAGRVAERPRSCISLRPSLRSRIVDNAIVYEESQRLWYVNRPDGGRCTSLRPNRTIVTRTSTSQLCRGDIVRVIDPPGPIEYGACGLDDFVPYRKAK
jgi:hypothetical protein